MSQDASATSDVVISVIAKKSNALRTYVRECAYVRTLRLCCARRSKYARAHACTNVRTYVRDLSFSVSLPTIPSPYVRTYENVRTYVKFVLRPS